jgi:redox-sensitive bicupin YhaK (pirin superfamily)
MDVPTYFPLTADETPYITSNDGLMRINIQAGKLEDIKGPIPTLSDVNTFTVNAQKGGKFYFEIPAPHNAFVYVLNGKIKLQNAEAEAATNFLIVLNKDGNGFEVEALEDSLLMIGTGEPLNEPVASHGPFVMNNQTQIMEAFRDYEMGKMGVLIEG